jgi:hypothetical protein
LFYFLLFLEINSFGGDINEKVKIKRAGERPKSEIFLLILPGPSVSNLNARDQTGAINLKIFPQKQVELIQLVFN